MPRGAAVAVERSEEHTSELQSHHDLVCRLLLEKKKTNTNALAAALNNAPNTPGVYNVVGGQAALVVAAYLACFVALAAVVLFRRDFFFNDTATTEIYTLSLHDALPI